jgi:hypothetical protein
VSDVALLARALKRVVGYGAKPHLLAKRPRLVALVNVPEDANADTRVIGELIREELLRGIERISGDQYLPSFARPFSAYQVKLALKLLLGLTHDTGGKLASTRRAWALDVLKIPRSQLEQWRRPDSPEFDLVMILARALLDRG